MNPKLPKQVVTPISTFIKTFIDDTPSFDTDNKPMRVRIHERNKSVEDFSISYRVDKIKRKEDEDPIKYKRRFNAPRMHKSHIFNFTIKPAIFQEKEGYIFKRVSNKSTTDVFVSELPVRGELRTCGSRRILDLFFECDVVYTATGKGRYNKMS